MSIFISYSQMDEKEANEISEKLAKKNIAHFLASKSIKTSELFEERIRDDLRKCKALFLLLTPNSLKSEWVVSEWSAAWALGKHIFPILLRCGVDDLPSRLSKLHVKDYHKIDEIIKEYEEIIGTNPPPHFPSSRIRGTILFDIDGTLLKQNETFRSDRGREVVQILESLIKEGYKIVLITGNDYKVQHKRVLLPFIEQNIAHSVFCFSDGGSRAFEFNEDSSNFKEVEEYSKKNLIAYEQAEKISSVFYSLLSDFLGQNDKLLIPQVDLYERSLNYIDLVIQPIRPSFRKNDEKFDEFCQEIQKICNDRREMKTATFELFAESSNSSIIIRAHGQDPEADVYKLQGLIYRNILWQPKYRDISKPEIEKRGGEVICQIALKPFNQNNLRNEFRKALEAKLKTEGYEDFSILNGGRTTIDIQLKGVDKAKAIKYLIRNKGYNPNTMIYFGDEFNKHGNDYPIISMETDERPQFIVNVGELEKDEKEELPQRIIRDLIFDGNGPNGTKNYLELLLFQAKS